MVKRKALDILFWVALLWLFTPISALAYLDPGTGSYVIQIVIGALLGVGFAVKSFWHVLKAKVSGLFSKSGT